MDGGDAESLVERRMAATQKLPAVLVCSHVLLKDSKLIHGAAHMPHCNVQIKYQVYTCISC